MTEVLKDTTTSQVEKTLNDMRQRTGVRTVGRVLTLVIMAQKGHSRLALEAAVEASHEHPCRIIVHIAHDAQKENRLDAEISLGGEAGASEVVILRGWGESSEPTESLVSALLLPDAPIVAWWCHEVPQDPAGTSIGRIAHRRITDSARAESPWDALESLKESYRPGTTDLAWTRLTEWRIQLAAVLDTLPRGETQRVVVEGSERSPSVILLGTWLGYRLGAPVEVATTSRPRGLYRVTLQRSDGDVTLHRPGRSVATLTQPQSPEQQIALPVRSLAQCMTEELRRLDPDEVFGEILTQALWTTEITASAVSAEQEDETSQYTEFYDA